MTRVRVADPSEKDAVLDTLMLAFSTDPCLRYLLDTPNALFRGFRPFATAMGGAAAASGAAWLADDGTAGALWLPPGVRGDSDAIDALIGETVSPETQAVAEQVGEGMDRHHPEEPHWYLSMIGVDPARQGRGLGSALLAQTLAIVDADRLPAYLESSNPRNTPLYERFGFEVIGQIQPADFPGLTPMLRPARR